MTTTYTFPQGIPSTTLINYPNVNTEDRESMRLVYVEDGDARTYSIDTLRKAWQYMAQAWDDGFYGSFYATVGNRLVPVTPKGTGLAVASEDDYITHEVVLVVNNDLGPEQYFVGSFTYTIDGRS